MPLPRLFRSSQNEWISHLIIVARGLVSVGNCVPFPYVNTALSAGLALLELIQTVEKSGDELRYFAESVVATMKLLREELDSHPTTENMKFRQVCEEFTGHLTQLSKDLESMSRNWSSSKFKKYLNSRNVQEEIALFTRRVNDLRANTTLIAATGTRMDLAEVATEVAAVKAMVSDLQRAGFDPCSPVPSESLKQELIRFEEDFYALKLADIYLDFRTARAANFPEMSLTGRERKRTAWTDYKATVNGSIRTVRVYQGSDPTESWKGFLSFLADNSPSPYLPQLFGFCSSPRLRALVFHGDYRSLDEYGNTLPSAQAIVDWELGLIADFQDLAYRGRRNIDFASNVRFAMVNAQDGKLILSHIDQSTPRFHHIKRSSYAPFLEWFVYAAVSANLVEHRLLSGSGFHAREALASLVDLQRRDWIPAFRFRSVHETLLCRGCVYDSTRGFWLPAAQLGSRAVAPEDSWRVVHMISHETDCEEFPGFPPDNCFPVAETELRHGFTHFIVPLMGETQRWISWHDHEPNCGYFLNARIEFGGSLPDITHAWMAQASSVFSKLTESSNTCKPDAFYVPIETTLDLMWEMSLATKYPTFDSVAILNDLPEKIHVFVQVPTVHQVHVEEPQIYWSTNAQIIETGHIPRGALKIRMSWVAHIDAARWEPHHYEVATTVQKDHGFDPITTAAARSLNLPLLEIPDLQEPCNERTYEYSLESGWLGYCEKDPHSLQAIADPRRQISNPDDSGGISPEAEEEFHTN
ncbi:hypothetical protein MVEN_00922700 [Mycena venus]|uniref:Uncharacterized protein n=1 Tax=Mycena venus TaxID=2733690 RepID=A0A8H6Y7X2_9AGAR|nr:hypothetical protein MVEN_00922700 [Mycena venus]